MTYRSAIKMTDQYNDNFAVIDGLYLTEGQTIMVKQYTYGEVSGVVKPISYNISTLSSVGVYNSLPNDPATFLSSADGVLTVKEGQTGTYKMYVNNRRQIYLHPTETPQAYPAPRSRAPGIKRANVTENINTIKIYFDDQSTGDGDGGWWTYWGDDDRIPRIELTNIVFESSANYGSLAYTSLPSVTNLTYSSKTAAVAKMSQVGTDVRHYEFEFPWYIASFDYKFFTMKGYYPNYPNWDNSNSRYWHASTKTYAGIGGTSNLWSGSATRASNSYYQCVFQSNDAREWAGPNGVPTRFGSTTVTNTSNNTTSVKKYTITYYKNDTNTQLGNAINRYYNSYYLPEDSYKTAGGNSASEWRGWFTSSTYGTTYAGGFLTAADTNVTIVGKYVRITYFKLYIIKQRYNGGTPLSEDPVLFDNSGNGYETSDNETQFDPSSLLTNLVFTSTYGSNYTYTASTATWNIGSASGTAYDKSTFSSFGYTSETAVCLYTTVVEKTLKIRKYAAKLNNDWSTTAWTSSSYIEETWGADETKTPIAFTSENLTTLGFSADDKTNYEAYDSSWRNGDTVGSTAIVYPKKYSTTTTQNIYYLYRPKKNTVTYNYEFYIREKTGVTAQGVATYGNYSQYSKISLVSDTFDAYVTTAFTLADHHPTHETYVVSDAQDKRVYKFEWDNHLWNATTGDDFTSATFGVSSTAAQRTFTVKMYATYEKIYVANENTNDANWYSAKNYYLQVVGTKDGGDANIDAGVDSSGSPIAVGSLGSAYRFLMNMSEDGINYFYISDGISFRIYNGGSTGNTDYTTLTTNTSSPDSYGAWRGVYTDAITISDDMGGEYYRDWRWSTYYGTASKSAKIYFNDADLNKAMSHGDGKHYLFVCDSGYNLVAGKKFAVRITVNGTYKWFDYDDLDEDSKLLVGEGGALANLGETNDASAAKSTVETVDNAIEITDSATYNIYLTPSGQLAISTAPSKGDGYYIMNYDEDGVNGNANLNSYVGGVKMRRTGYYYNYNVAYYNCFAVSSACRSVYMKAYIGGVDYGPFTHMGETTLASMDEDTGVITFVDPGNYSIFIQLTEVGGQDRYTVFISRYPDNFYILNSLPDAAGKVGGGETVKDYNTTLILEIEFTYTASVPNDAQIGIDVIRSASGSSANLSQFLIFNVMCSDEELGKDSYALMRRDYYDSASSFSSDSLKLTVFDETNTVSADTTNAPQPHYLYILIDYIDFTPKNADNAKLQNDFTISLKARSL